MLTTDPKPLFPEHGHHHRLAIQEVTPRSEAANDTYEAPAWPFAWRVLANTLGGAAFMAALLMAPWLLQRVLGV